MDGAFAEYVTVPEKICWSVASLEQAYDDADELYRAAATVEPRIAKPVIIATKRWNHSTKLAQLAGNSPIQPSHSGQRPAQVRPAPMAPVYTPSRMSPKVSAVVAVSSWRKRVVIAVTEDSIYL